MQRKDGKKDLQFTDWDNRDNGIGITVTHVANQTLSCVDMRDLSLLAPLLLSSSPPWSWQLALVANPRLADSCQRADSANDRDSLTDWVKSKWNRTKLDHRKLHSCATVPSSPGGAWKRKSARTEAHGPTWCVSAQETYASIL